MASLSIALLCIYSPTIKGKCTYHSLDIVRVPTVPRVVVRASNSVGWNGSPSASKRGDTSVLEARTLVIKELALRCIDMKDSMLLIHRYQNLNP